MTYRKKLIEVALPLEAINAASSREKSIRHGHPSTLHLWWSRKPLATCRAVLFASLVDDPSAHPDQFPTEEAQQAERERLFRIIEDLVQWENSNDEAVLSAARAEILRSTGGHPPPVLDPFCGGGSIPLEAQRLGLEAHASDLNPVAVMITKALIEIPPKFANQPPANPDYRSQSPEARKLNADQWKGAKGLAEDVRHYGQWMRDEAEKRLGHLYPKVKVVREKDGSYRHATQSEIENRQSKIENLTVIAWLWARTVTCPNPACRATMPLVRSFWLSTKPGKKAWVEPHPSPNGRGVGGEGENEPSVTFAVCTGNGAPPDGGTPSLEGTVNRKGATCLCCGTPVPFDHIRTEGKAGRMGAQMMAIVAEGERGRVYLPPTDEHERIAKSAKPRWKPETDLPEQALGFRVQGYGMRKHADLFTLRQLVALTTFADLVQEAREKVLADMRSDELTRHYGAAYADAVATYLAFALDRLADRECSLATWQNSADFVRGVFARQTLSMMWDYAEVNPFSQSTGNFYDNVEWVAEVVEAEKFIYRDFEHSPNSARQHDASKVFDPARSVMISTDPPYYDNIGYADLSDFFYVWLRHSLSKVYPELFGTLLAPKAPELIATPYRFDGSKDKARQFFETGLGQAFIAMRQIQHEAYPFTVYYAFKQAEEDDVDGDGESIQQASTGWETMLEGLLQANFSVTGTWPMHTERASRTRSIESNALASSIVLVCRPRPEDAPVTTRREFVAALRRELPDALRTLQRGNIAPVDLAQAAIGPGMAVYSRYSQVLEADGSPMRVRTALGLINAMLDEVLAEQEGDYDADTRWALAWFDQYGMEDGPFGVAETLSKAKVTSVARLQQDGVLRASGGKVRLLRRDELVAPASSRHYESTWEATQHLIHALETDGESGAAALLAQVGGMGDAARDLAYRLYTTCERKGWAKEALAYNSLVVAWPEIARLAAAPPADEAGQVRLL